MEDKRLAIAWILELKSVSLEDRVATSRTAAVSAGAAAEASVTPTEGATVSTEVGAATSATGALAFLGFFSTTGVGATVSTVTVTEGAEVTGVAEAAVDFVWRTILLYIHKCYFFK
jgi:hypothetical protein